MCQIINNNYYKKPIYNNYWHSYQIRYDSSLSCYRHSFNGLLILKPPCVQTRVTSTPWWEKWKSYRKSADIIRVTYLKHSLEGAWTDYRMGLKVHWNLMFQAHSKINATVGVRLYYKGHYWNRSKDLIETELCNRYDNGFYLSNGSIAAITFPGTGNYFLKVL